MKVSSAAQERSTPVKATWISMEDSAFLFVRKIHEVIIVDIQIFRAKLSGEIREGKVQAENCCFQLET